MGKFKMKCFMNLIHIVDGFTKKKEKHKMSLAERKFNSTFPRINNSFEDLIIIIYIFFTTKVKKEEKKK